LNLFFPNLEVFSPKMARFNEKFKPVSEIVPDIESEQVLAQDATDDTTARGSNMVDWDGKDDLEKPTNWTSKKKRASSGLLALMTLITYGT
jgi:hypothetical protein